MMVIKFHFIHFGVANITMFHYVSDLNNILKKLNWDVLTLIFQLVKYLYRTQIREWVMASINYQCQLIKNTVGQNKYHCPLQKLQHFILLFYYTLDSFLFVHMHTAGSLNLTHLICSVSIRELQYFTV